MGDSVTATESPPLPATWRPNDTPTLRLARSLGRLLPPLLPACVLGSYHTARADWWACCTDGTVLPVCDVHRIDLAVSGRLASHLPIADPRPTGAASSQPALF